MQKHTLISLSAIMALNLTGLQAEESISLGSIVATEKIDKKKALNAPYASTIITAEDIREQGHRNIPELLRSVPGLHVSINAQSTTFLVRGQQVAGGQGVMIYIDGRKAVYSGGASNGITQGHNLDNIPIEMIESIEVVKAPSASIYGAGASHGVINITTKSANKGTESFFGSISASIGSWDSYKANISAYGRQSSIDYSTTVSVDQTDGYRGIDKSTLLAEFDIGYNIDNENRIGIKFGTNKNDRLHPENFKTLEDLKAHSNSPRVVIPESSGRRGKTPQGYKDPTHEDSTLIYGGLDYKGKVADMDVTSSLNISNLKADWVEPGTVFVNGKKEDDALDDRTNDIIEYNLKLKKKLYAKDGMTDNITFGVDYEYFKYDNKASDSKRTTVTTTSKRYGLFINNQFTYNKFSALAGLRYDSMEWDLKNANDHSYDGKHEKTSWDIAPSYKINENTNVFYSLSESYWFPNSFHLSMPSWFERQGVYAPTPEGQVPEKNLNHELGIKQIVSDNFNYSVTLFHTETKDKYVATYDAPGRGFASFTGFKPLGNASSQGMEISFDGMLSDLFAFRGTMAYTDMTWDSGTTTGSEKIDISGNELPDTPQISYSLGVTFFPINNMLVALDINHDDEAFGNFENTVKYDSFTTVDAKISYDYSPSLSFYVLSSNLLDEEHYKISGGHGGGFEPHDGRYIEAGFTKKF